MHILSNLSFGQVVAIVVVIGMAFILIKGMKTPPRGQGQNGQNGGTGTPMNNQMHQSGPMNNQMSNQMNNQMNQGNQMGGQSNNNGGYR